MINNNKKDSTFTFFIQAQIDSIQKQYLLIYRTLIKNINILDIKSNKLLFIDGQLKFKNSQTFIDDFIIGKKITLINKGKQLFSVFIKGYADQFTKKVMSSLKNIQTKAFFMIKPGFIDKKELGQIITLIQNDFKIERIKLFKLSQENLQKYIINEQFKNLENNIKNFQYLSSAPLIGFQIKANNALIKLKCLMGTQNSIEAKKTQPFSLRAKYGLNIIQNCCYGSQIEQKVQKQINFIFSSQVQQLRPQIKNSSLILVKPHIIEQRKMGELFYKIIEKRININALKYQKVDQKILTKYLDFYKFLPQYSQNLKQFLRGITLALELNIGKDENSVERIKKQCGAYDPTYAKKIDPSSLRAIFGKNRVQNAIQCTELEEDTSQEIKLIFSC